MPSLRGYCARLVDEVRNVAEHGKHLQGFGRARLGPSGMRDEVAHPQEGTTDQGGSALMRRLPGLRCGIEVAQTKARRTGSRVAGGEQDSEALTGNAWTGRGLQQSFKSGGRGLHRCARVTVVP